MNPLHTFVENFTGSPLAGAIGWTLLHSLWQGVLISTVLAAVVVASRSPRIRYAAAGVAMLALVASFLATFIHFFPFAEHASRVFKPSALPRWNLLPDLSPSEGSGFSLAALAPWLAPFWLAGVCLIYARSLAACLSVRRLRRRGVCSANSNWQQELARLAQLARVSRPVQLLESCLTDTPIVLGHFRPVILVPLGLLAGLPPAQIEAIFLHELAHIRRHDFLVNILQLLAEGLLFYHPAVWWISGVMRRERELCCDDAVVFIHADKQEYARALAALEHHRVAAGEAAIAATGGSLMNRIRRLLSPQAPSTNAWAPFLATALLAAAVAISGAVWQSQVQAASRGERVQFVSPSRPAAQISQVSPLTISMPGDQMQANVVKLVPPVYPEVAKTARISGTVVLHAIVGTDGRVDDLQYVSGPPLLMRSAMEAVRQWEYRRIFINGEPIRVDTSVSVAFGLDRVPPQQQSEAMPPASLPGLPPAPPTNSTMPPQDTQRAQEMAQFQERVDKVKAAMDEARRNHYSTWVTEEVVYIIDDAERAAYLSLKTDEERGKFIEQFWERRNPNPGSSTSLIKEEHYRRIAYANQHFAGDGIAGWRTDRGHMYIVYGPPGEINSHPKDANHAIGKEAWLYHHIEGLGDNLEFTFIDRTGLGDYRLAPSATSPTN